MKSRFFSSHITKTERRAGPPAASTQDLLLRASHGDMDAAASIMSYLTAGLVDLRQIMQKAIHACPDVNLWRCMLNYLAVGEWGEWDPFGDNESSRQRRLSWKEPQTGLAAQVITELFVIDQSESEGAHKQLVLTRALHGPGPLRNAAACLLGLRGDTTVIPTLEDMICGGGDPAAGANESWELRAIEALAALGDARGGPALLCALTSGRGPVHQAAARALRELGPQAEDVLLLALLHPDSHIRWHAARGLGAIGNPNGIETLLEGLRDEHQAVRWATAETLAQMDAPAIPYILKMLIQYPLTETLRQAIYHALHAMSSSAAQEYLRPLLVALRDPTAPYEAPVVAQRMLAEWKHVPSPAESLERRLKIKEPFPPRRAK